GIGTGQDLDAGGVEQPDRAQGVGQVGVPGELAPQVVAPRRVQTGCHTQVGAQAWAGAVGGAGGGDGQGGDDEHVLFAHPDDQVVADDLVVVQMGQAVRARLDSDPGS